MLVEALIYALSLPETPRPFRRHLFGAVGLWSRGRRQARAWAPHLRATRAFIEAQIPAIGDRRSVVVLGSGPLFDVPLAALAEAFGEVVLVDRAHLLPTALAMRGYRNVRRQWTDLAASALPEALGHEPDWVISTNLLSQLALAAPEGAERQAVADHLAALAALRCPATLITDTSYRVLDRGGRELRRSDLLHGHALPAGDAKWQWEVAPLGEESRSTSRVHAVSAWADARPLAAVAGKGVYSPLPCR